MSRRKAREMAMQLLFQEEMHAETPAEVVRLFWKCHQASPEVKEYCEALFRCALDQRETIDSLIRRFARHWKLERIAPVERNVLRMATAEMLFSDTPRAVIIDEAIEIARKFGSEKSPEFVNGILDAIAGNVERSPV